MLTREENEIIVHTGPGTPMGEVMRRYEPPVLLSWELEEPDCRPVRAKLVGEELTAFKDTAGNIAVVAAFQRLQVMRDVTLISKSGFPQGVQRGCLPPDHGRIHPGYGERLPPLPRRPQDACGRQPQGCGDPTGPL